MATVEIKIHDAGVSTEIRVERTDLQTTLRQSIATALSLHISSSEIDVWDQAIAELQAIRDALRQKRAGA